jgi:hypothetical protein
VKDRLSAAARDKLAQTTKDKQVKAERKRKAAMFLTMLRSSNTPQPNHGVDDTGTDAHGLGKGHIIIGILKIPDGFRSRLYSPTCK